MQLAQNAPCASCTTPLLQLWEGKGVSWISGPSIDQCLYLQECTDGSASFLNRLGERAHAEAEAEAMARRQADDDGYWKIEMRLMHPGNAAAVLGVGTRTVLAWARRGWIRYSPEGGRYHHAYSSDDVLALADRMRGRGMPSAHLITALGWPDRGASR